jgi:four helix bundle protein
MDDPLVSIDCDAEFYVSEERSPYPVAKRFEELEVWRRARALNARIYEATRAPSFSKDFGLANQSQRASISVMANIAEGFERRGSGEFAQFSSHSKGSSGELRSHLYAAYDVGYISEELFNELFSSCEEVSRLIHNLYAAVQKSRK